MNHLVWNCRGVGNRRTVRDLLALARVNHPKLVFLCETRQAAVKVERIKWRLGLRGFRGVDPEGRSGGLGLFWDESLQVTVLEACSRFIDVRIFDPGVDKQWRATFVYGERRVENRRFMWDHMARLRSVSSEPWVVCGDYNECMWQHEHLSSTARSSAQMVAFRDCLQLCELVDLGFSGMPFTYNNNQFAVRNVQVRLDRCCADEAWRDLFPNVRVKHLMSSASDHCPLLLEVEVLEPDKRRHSGGRYKIMWERHAALPDIIAKAWTKRRAYNLGQVAANLKDVMKDLRDWSRNNFGQVSKQIEVLRTELEELQLSNADRSVIKEKMYVLDELLYREEMMWLQRSRIMWLKEGDRNTQYFHRKAIWRARKNLIRRLRKEDGSWCSTPSMMELMAKSYFQTLHQGPNAQF